MKTRQNHHLLVSASTRRDDDSSDGNSEFKEPVIRLKLDKPSHWDWQLTTTADALPVIKLLDKDGKLLVKTSGHVAQRARGSFRHGLKSHESFPEPPKENKPDLFKSTTGNRNYEGFSTKHGPVFFGFKPRKSRSEATVSSASSSSRRKSRKRHSSNESKFENLRTTPMQKESVSKQYWSSDNSNQQSINNFSDRNELLRVSPNEAERDKYKTIKGFLGSRTDSVKQSSMCKESLSNSLKEGNVLNDKENERKKTTFNLSGKILAKEDLNKIRMFLQEKIQAKMQEENLLRRTFSFPIENYNQARKNENNSVPIKINKFTETVLDCDKEDEKYELPSNYKLTHRENDTNIRLNTELPEKSSCKLEIGQQPALKKSSSISERRKIFKKIRSNTTLNDHSTESSFDSKIEDLKENNYSIHCINSQDNFDQSWREYKERKKQERLQKDLDPPLLVEEDFMKKPRWKDLQDAFCRLKNCKFCENIKSYVNLTRTSNAVSNLNEDEKDNLRPDTSLQENYLMIEPPKALEPEEIIQRRYHDSDNIFQDFCCDSIFGCTNGINRKFGDSCTHSNVKKSDTFKIINSEDNLDLCDIGEVCYDYKNKTNEDIVKDYFRRVHKLLSTRQAVDQRILENPLDENYEGISFSNYLQEEARIMKHQRRKKIDKFAKGEDTVLVVVSPSTVVRREIWKSLNGSATTFRSQQQHHHHQQQQQQQQQQQRQEGSSLAKRPRHPAPPLPPPPQCDFSSSADKENEPDRDEVAPVEGQDQQCDMGSNLSRHNGKGLNGRRAQSSGNLCDPKGTNVGKLVLPCTRSSRDRYKFCGSLPNHLDGKDSLDDNTSENNNIITDTISGNLGGTLPHKKRSGATQFSDESSNTLDLVKHGSEESLGGDPWKYRQEGADLAKCQYAQSIRKSRGSDAGTGSGRGNCRHYEWRRNSSTLSRGRTHRSAELDVVGTLPKRSQNSTKRSAPSLGEMSEGPTRASRISIDKIDDELLFKMVHKPDCELMKHHQENLQQHQPHAHQLHKQEKCVDLKLHKLTTGGEPQDQGYASERSPEDEHPPILPGNSFPSVTPESTFRVTLKKSSRGLGLSVSGGGTAGPVRVKRLFPQQPASLSNKLQPGDILLAANGIPLTGLTNYEALEVLRTTSSTVELVVCRLPGDTIGTPPGMAPPPPPTRRDNPGLSLKIPLNPLPLLDIEPCGEFDIEMTKVAGSLGFTLRKADSSALGHYVRALVREPALSDGRIQPGDKIVAVDGALLSPMSHEEAVTLLRQCGPRVTLRLYRDLVQTPVSALSPIESDCPVRPTKTSLRQEAVDMLCDLAVRKLSPGTSSGSTCPRQSSSTSCNSPRRLRRPATRSSPADMDEGSSNANRKNQHYSHASSLSQETSDSDQCSIKTQITNSQPETPANDIIDPPPLYDVCDSSDTSSIKACYHQHQYQHLNRPSFLDLCGPTEKPRFQFSIDSDCSDNVGPIIITDSDNSNLDYTGRDCGATILSNDEQDVNLISEPTSMPPLLNNEVPFSYKNPAYQSANPACGLTLPVESGNTKVKLLHSSEQDIPGKIMGADDPVGSKGLLKWKGVMFAPSNADEIDGKCKMQVDRDTTESATLSSLHEQGHEVFMVELTRGWNSRLGFSLQPEGENTVISVVHPDSVAAKDGRLKQGDILVMVNDESVEHMSTANIIDLLRKIRGSIGITVLRRKKEDGT